MEKKLVRKEILNMRNNMSNEKRILKDKLIYNLFINKKRGIGNGIKR